MNKITLPTSKLNQLFIKHTVNCVTDYSPAHTSLFLTGVSSHLSFFQETVKILYKSWSWKITQISGNTWHATSKWTRSCNPKHRSIYLYQILFIIFMKIQTQLWHHRRDQINCVVKNECLCKWGVW